MENEKYLFVVSGAAGTGKDSVVKALRTAHPEIEKTVSATTRAPRPGEQEGVDYYYRSVEQFRQLIDTDQVVEHNFYNGNYYGSPRGPIEEELSKGHDVILEIETNGAGHIRRMFPSALSIFVVPPSFEELKKRLIGRGTESPEEISARLEKGRAEIEMALDYDYIVVNDEVETAARRLAEIIRSARWSKKFNQSFIQEVLNNA